MAMSANLALPSTQSFSYHPEGAIAPYTTAKMANYPASRGTNTTRTGSYHATNPNQPVADIQRVGMMFTAEMMAKMGGVGWTYLLVRGNSCEPVMWMPATGDDGLNRVVSEFLKNAFAGMGVDGSMFDSVARTIHLEVPIRGDAGLIFHRDALGCLRLIEFSGDMLGEPLFFINPKKCSLTVDDAGNWRETAGRDLVYYAGRYFKGCDCVAYKIFQRNAAGFWSDPVIYLARDVIYVKDPFNFRGFRGVTKFAQVLQYMEKSESMLQSAVDTGIRQSREFGQVYNNSGQPNGPVEYEEPGFTWDQAAVTLFQKAPNGPFERYLFNGDKAEFQAPTHPGGNIIDGVRAADEKICNGLGMTYGFVIAYDRLGGAPSRLDVNRNTKEIERIINRISKPVLNRITWETIRDGVNKGFLPPEPNIYKGEWMFATLPTADAFRESRDDVLSVRAGQESNTRVLARYNTTPEEIMRERSNEVYLAYKARQETKDLMAKNGIEGDPLISEFMASSDNPNQQQQAEQLEEGRPTTITDKQGQVADT